MPEMRAVLLGAGRTACRIAPALMNCGIRWVQVYNRTYLHALDLASRIGTSATDSLDTIDRSADLYVLAVSDAAVVELGRCLRLPGKIVFHVAGSVPLSALQEVSEHHGVMYFFQTFSKDGAAPDFRKIPVCIEASDDFTADRLRNTAMRLSDHVCYLTSEQREVLHLGGVFVNNYVNLMYTAAFELFVEAGMDFSLLHPLMEQTLQKAESMPPAQVQTGPAMRGEAAVLEKHLRRLAGSEQGKEYVEIYRLLAQTIKKRFAENE